MATSNAIKLANDSTKALMEQHFKTSSMINTVLIKLIENDTNGTSKERIVKRDYMVW